MWGFVLANVTPGKESEFFTNLGSLSQVRGVYYLFDEYEYLLEVEANDSAELANVMTNHIRHLPGVERTATFIQGTRKDMPAMDRDSEKGKEPPRTLY